MIRFIQALAIGLLVFSCKTDNKECSIPKIIKDNGLEKEYSQAIEDWYKINHHVYAKNGGFLVAIDSIVDSKIWVRDTNTGYMNVNRDLTSDYRKMVQKFPNKIFKYNEVSLVLFSENIDEIVDGDTFQQFSV